MCRVRIAAVIVIVVLGMLVVNCASAVAGTAAKAFTVEVADIEGSAGLVRVLEAKGIHAVIFPKNEAVENAQTNRAIWIGRNVPLDVVRVTIREALIFNPYLCFFHVVGDRGEAPPEKVHNTIHVGGSDEAAFYMELAAIPADELRQSLDQAKTLQEFHAFLHKKNMEGRRNSSHPDHPLEGTGRGTPIILSDSEGTTAWGATCAEKNPSPPRPSP